MKHTLGFVSFFLYCGSFYLLSNVEWSEFAGVIIFGVAAVTAIESNKS